MFLQNGDIFFPTCFVLTHLAKIPLPSCQLPIQPAVTKMVIHPTLGVKDAMKLTGFSINKIKDTNL
jgi:hypothetical protein